MAGRETACLMGLPQELRDHIWFFVSSETGALRRSTPRNAILLLTSLAIAHLRFAKRSRTICENWP